MPNRTPPDSGRLLPAWRAMLERRILAIGSIGLVLAIAAFVLVPIVVAVVLSFSDSRLLRFPVSSWSLRWYQDFFGSHQFAQALVNSLWIAAGTTLVSVPVGTLAAWALRQWHRARRVLSFVVMLPLFLPGVVLGLGLAVTFGATEIFGWSIFGTRFIVVLAHSLWSMPLVFMIMDTAFRSLDKEVIEASADLGAPPLRTFFEIVLPSVSVSLLSSTLFSFVISLNEFYMALFLTTRDTQTLPVLMWLSLRSAGSPRLAVAAVILMFVVILALAVFYLFTRRRKAGFAVP